MPCLSSPTTLHIGTVDPAHSATAMVDVAVSKLDILPLDQKSQSPSGMKSERDRTFGTHLHHAKPTHPGTHYTHRGNNNRALIASTVVHSADRAQLPHAHQPPPHATSACYACHRIADTTVCMDCGQWHHPACIPHCQVVLRHSTPTYGLHTIPLLAARTHSVGDGSVTNQDKPVAHGTWSYLGRDGTTLVGYVRIHPDHITPTRCEIHSLLAGLHHSGDTVLQICDNTTRHMQAAYWFVVPDGSPDHTLVDSLPITWFLTIPSGQITYATPPPSTTFPPPNAASAPLATPFPSTSVS
ncbi:hypothetical protein H257_16383 [Aphanomyces astaci]|uniref:Uncharacterized protein n=1 Tax=Aphanomyces astaci TaxID=112090 RepID=W4FIT6_APHAT|nr:hypothetical protein H257_16383 [Aphanomyces astaci]ETV67405.1 hypothetical protein H257_16383 [Aphanomyces astaci]|eukprot:XP_009843096.1 hypothetical protein H257_16383 [Aphanomyces astaci]